MEGTQDTEITQIEQQPNIIKDKKTLPKDLHPYFSMEIIKNGNISTQEKLALVKTYGKGTTSWVVPKTEIQKQFALDSMIFQLYEDAQQFRCGTMIALPDKAISWVLK